jgi:hypothetical protein
MRKNITALLQRGNIKPSDRVKLLVADMASRERDGKPLLTEADKHALREGWTPKNNEEVREYNRFNEGWKNVAYAEMDAQTTYLQATVNLLRADKLVSYIITKNRLGLENKDAKEIKEQLKNGVKELKKDYDLSLIQDVIESEQIKEHLANEEALKLTLEYMGLEIGQVIYLYAFELADETLREDLLALYPEANTERGYLEQEEIIYNLFKDKEKLNQSDKEKLAELITDECFNEYSGYWRFDGYFASLPLFELLGKWAVYYNEMPKKPEDLYKHFKGEPYESESEEVADCFNAIKELTPKLINYAEKHNTTPRELLKETIIKWLDDGLFAKDFTPLFRSEDKATCNKRGTKETHKEVFKKWLEVKAKATETIRGLIDKGELKTAQKTRTFQVKNLVDSMLGKDTKEPKQDTPERAVKETKTIITGESLYNFKGDFTFAKDFKEQAEDIKIIWALVLFLRKCRFVKDYSTLLAFELLFKELSKTFETDLTYSIKKWLESFKSELEQLRREFLMLGDDIRHANYKSDRVYYLSESPIEDLMTMPFDPDKIKPDMDGRIKVYAGKIKDILQDDFKNPFDYEK